MLLCARETRRLCLGFLTRRSFTGVSRLGVNHFELIVKASVISAAPSKQLVHANKIKVEDTLL